MNNELKFKKIKSFKLVLFTFIFGLGLIGLLFAITITNNSISQENNVKKNINLEYVRSPYATEFTVKDFANYKFIYALSHFDSIGVLKNKNSLNKIETESKIKNQGTQEIEEAKNLVNVLNFFTDIFNNQNIIFMADTNIKLGNQSLAFKNLLESKYKILFDDKPTYNTTLSTIAVNDFVNPYDKF
ncbi:MAG: hypothetical protein K2H11_00115, partial [Malacoplasma sp.]|nr:hypothetical protein [Malacoplasma sp.]